MSERLNFNSSNSEARVESEIDKPTPRSTADEYWARQLTEHIEEEPYVPENARINEIENAVLGDSSEREER